MTTPDDLDAKTNQELNEIFAVEVSGLYKRETPHRGGVRAYSVIGTGAWREVRDGGYAPDDLPDYSTDANAVLPWLENATENALDIRRLPDGWGIALGIKATAATEWLSGRAVTFARAAVIALVRAARAAK